MTKMTRRKKLEKEFRNLSIEQGVKFHEKTGSRPYISHVHTLKEAHKAEELTAIDLFKECHNGKKTGLSEPVKKAIADMESAMEKEVPESGEPKSDDAVVVEILTKECPSSTFLQNAGLESTSKKKFNRSASALGDHVHD